MKRSPQLVRLLETKKLRCLRRHNVQLEKQVQERTAELQVMLKQVQHQAAAAATLNRIVQAIRSTLVLEEVLQITANQLHETLSVSRCMIYWPHIYYQIAPHCVSEATAQKDKLIEIHYDFYHYYYATLAQGKPVAIAKIDTSLPLAIQERSRIYNTKSVLIVPLIYQQCYLGGISLHQCDREREWTADEVALVQAIADHCCIAIQQAELYQQSQAELKKTQQIEKALQESEAKNSALIKALPDMMCRFDQDGIFLDFISAKDWEPLLPPSEFIGKAVGETLPPEITQPLTLAIEKVLQSNKVQTFEYQLSFEEVRDYEARIVTCGKDEVLAIVRDISDRKQVEKALRQSQERFYKAFNANPIASSINSFPEGRFLDVNKSWLDLLEYSQAEVIGRTSADLGLWESISDRDGVLQKLHQEGSIRNLEVNLRTKSGEIRNGLTCMELIDIDGTICNLVMLYDITERKQAEEALRQSEERFSKAFNSSPSATCISTFAEGRFIDVNDNFQRLIGYSRQELIGRTSTELKIYVNFDERQHLIHKRLKQAPIRDMEYKICTKSGETRDISISMERIDLCGEACILAQLLDITDRKQAELALQKANEELEIRVEERTAELIDTNKQLRCEIAERQLVETANALLATAVEYAGDAIQISDAQVKLKYVNPAFEQITGYKRSEVLGKNLFTLFSRDKRNEEAYRAIHKTLNKGLVWRGQLIGKRKDESLLYQDVTISPVFDARGVITHYVAVKRDITERKQAEEALRRSKQQFKALVEHNPDVIERFDRQLRHVYVNPAIELASGLSAEVFIGKTCQELGLPDEVVSIWNQAIQTVFETGSQDEIEFAFLAPNGTKYYQARIVPEFATDGSIETVLGISRDITKLKVAELSLRESEERFRSLNVSSPVGIFQTDVWGHCIYTNPRCQTIWGFTHEESLGEGWLQFVHPEDRYPVYTVWSACTRAGLRYCDEFRLQNREGVVRWVCVRSSPMFSDEGELIGHVGTVEDITDRKQAEAEILNALAKEKELNELKSRFVSMVSHEFRTPLSTILLYTELLEHYNHKWDEEKKHQHFQRIQTAVKNMEQLLNDVLIIGKAEAGKVELNLDWLNLTAFCQDLASEMQLGAGKGHTITFVNEGCCDWAYLDEQLLRQILTNLLSNALKYSPQRGIVDFSCCCQDGVATFQVRDEGIGIPLEDQQHLFETFYRATNVGTIPGTGLGLAIVKQCVDLHAGQVNVSSTVGKGTTFTVKLPGTSDQ